MKNDNQYRSNRLPQWLINEWDYEKNLVKPEKYSVGSNSSVWWICENNHSWQQIIRNRKAPCSYCSHRKLWTGFNDLNTLSPELLEEWDYSKNIISPSKILNFSSTSVWWKCRKNDHTWKARINARTNIKNPTGCPYCSNRRVLKGYNDINTTHPELAKEWDSKKNNTKIDEAMLYSKKVFFWICQYGHHYSMSGEKKILNQTCPYCSNKKVLEGFNDLLSKNLALSKEWDSVKNKDNPNEVYYKSYNKYWWLCQEKNHSWKASLANRISRNSGCPDCSHRISQGEFELRTQIQKIFHTKTIHNNRTLIKPYEIDIYLPSYGYAFEYNGDYWHSSEVLSKSHNMDSYNYHSKKFRISLFSNIQMFFVWQYDWENNKEDIIEALCILRDKNTISDILIKNIGVNG